MSAIAAAAVSLSTYVHKVACKTTLQAPRFAREGAPKPHQNEFFLIILACVCKHTIAAVALLQ